MALIDYTYFKGIITLDFSRADVKEKITEYSDYCEDKYFRLLMGNTQYYDYKQNPTAAKYVSLLATGYFTYGGETYYKDIKTMLAHFVFVHLSNDKGSFDSPLGMMQAANENATIAISKDKLVKAYNKAVDMYNDMYNYMNTLPTDFANVEHTPLQYANTFGI